MDGLKVAELVVVDVYGDGKEKASVPPVDELVVVVLDEVGVLLVAGGDEAVDLALDPDLLCLRAGARGGRWRNVPLGGGQQKGRKRGWGSNAVRSPHQGTDRPERPRARTQTKPTISTAGSSPVYSGVERTESVDAGRERERERNGEAVRASGRRCGGKGGVCWASPVSRDVVHGAW